MNHTEVDKSSDGPAPDQDPRVAMAAERTFLAWIRTGLALMGFGFVVARFGLFLHEMASLQHQAVPAGRGFSIWIGTSLIILGVVCHILATINHMRFLGAIHGSSQPQYLNTMLGNVVAIALALIGIATVIYFLTM